MNLCKDGKLRPRLVARTKEQSIHVFWSRVDIRGPNECWPWTRGMEGRNYGSFWANGERWRAHRFAAVLTNGPIPNGKDVCHTCDNPPCCNPSHLFYGTPLENMLDCNAKGRRNQERGEQRYCAKLTEDNVREIKRAALTRVRGFGAETARRYGVSKAAINNILRGVRWRHVTT